MTRVRDLPLIEWHATYDHDKKLISGCMQGSRTWHHEDRHRQQFSYIEKKMPALDTWISIGIGIGSVASLAALITGSMDLFRAGALLTSMAALRVIVFEIDAEFYSWIQWIKNKEVLSDGN